MCNVLCVCEVVWRLVAAKPTLRVGALQVGALRAGALQVGAVVTNGFPGIPGNSGAFPEIPGNSREFLGFACDFTRVGECWCAAAAGW